MTMTSACKLQVGRDQHDGKVRLEVDHIDFAGATKYRFRLCEIRSPRRESDSILFDFHGNPVTIKLTSARQSADWIEYILHPQTLMDKLGVKEGHTVRVMNLDDGDLLRMLEDRKTHVVAQPADRCDVVMLGVERPSELTQIEDLAASLNADGAIWVVLPKSVRTVTKANVLSAAREAGLSHVEMIDYSESQAAYKIVRSQSGRKLGVGPGNGSSSHHGAGNGNHRLSGRRTVVKA